MTMRLLGSLLIAASLMAVGQVAEGGPPKSPKPEERRAPAGEELCLTRGGEHFLRLRRNGSFEYARFRSGAAPLEVSGRWRVHADGTYELFDSPLVRDVQVGQLYVAIGLEANVPLVGELRAFVQSFLAAHRSDVITPEQLRTLHVRLDHCPPERGGSCESAQGSLGVFFVPSSLSTADRVARSDVESLLVALDDYARDPDKGVLRFRLDAHRSYRFANWLDLHSFWKQDPDLLRREIDWTVDSRSDRDSSRLPNVFYLLRCKDEQRMRRESAASAR